MIYLDNAATTLTKPPEVAEAVAQAICHMGNAGRGAHGASLDAARVIYETREKLCRLFGGKDPRQVAFTSNATESLNIAIKGILNPGDHVITTAMEHNSVLRPLYEMEKRGVDLTIVGANARGKVELADIEAAIRQSTRAIVAAHGSNLTGNCLDLEALGRIARKHGILLIIDASQTAGVIPIHVEQMNIDVLCFTGHKALCGPQGTGGIYVREGLNVRPLKSGGSGVQSFEKEHPGQMPAALEAGTLNSHGIAGLHAALEVLMRIGVGKIREREELLVKRFCEGIRGLTGIKIYGDFEAPIRCPVVTLNIGEYDSSEVADELMTGYGIYTRAGAHCAPLAHKALGTAEQGAVRFSFSYYNKEEEIDEAVRALRELAEG